MDSKKNLNPNRLINEKSPYLLQHAYNPVDWYPWGEEAFSNARLQNKPMFLSIGYSTCHWCHVMERESFEDSEVAELLNRFFVSIKVDREERPDIDHLYMEFCQALTGSGGWPLTIIMTPEKEPFYVGTYFPKHSKYGRPGLVDIASQLGLKWRENDAELRQSALKIRQTIQAQHTSPSLDNNKISFVGHGHRHALSDFQKWAEDVLHSAYQTLTQRFDSKWGGFGQAPKFPTPHTIGFLLRYAQDHPTSQASQMVHLTLDNMARGGIYDQVGFGFARYSTDEKWLVPHFEKMLYDNALLAYVYLEAYQEYQEEEYVQKAQEIFTYILRDMTSTEGGFYSAEDADSEGVEGKFYVWSIDEIQAILGQQEADLFCAAYDITSGGNFEGQNIPNLLQHNLPKIADLPNLKLPDVYQVLEIARDKLFRAREGRIHPHKDDKILTSWNSLMIAALAKGYQVIGNPSYLQAAERAHDFITQRLMSTDHRLLARYRDGETAYLGYLDDYAFLIWSSLELYSANGNPRYLQLALTLQAKQEDLFADTAGGYFLTGHDAETLLFRPKESYDGALPSGNSISILNLLRLARLTEDPQLETRALANIQAFAPTLAQYPAGYSAYLQALQLALHQTENLILSGPLESAQLSQMSKTFFQQFRPFSSILYQEGSLGDLIPWLKDYPVNADQVTAYLCQDFTCQQPVDNVQDLQNLLNN